MFVHDEPSLGYNITKIENPNNLKIIKNDTTESIFNMIGIMENASEIHCMESSIRCLIDHLPNINCPLHLHKIRDHGLVSTTKSKWISIEY
jgi:plasmid rolling circle replication initiator protein Rep